MEIVMVVLLVVILLLLIVSMFKGNHEADITERIGRVETNFIKELSDFKNDFSRTINEDFKDLNERIEIRLRMISDRVNERMDENFEKTNRTFTSVLERLSKIDEAQKKIDHLSTDIVSLQSILTDKKTRGIYGEVNLRHILSSVFGENNSNIYHLQHTFPNGVIADAVLFAPEPLGTIAIDSKFPLENYQRMVDKQLSRGEREVATRLFKQDMKKHIDAISSKYIILGETTGQAIMFLPAEAIFAEVNAYHGDLIEYGYKKNVWITSPTTLISTLTVVEMVIKDMQRDKYTAVIHEHINKLGEEFKRYRDRWDKLSRSIESVNKEVKDIYVTTEKITKKFDVINGADIERIESGELDE